MGLPYHNRYTGAQLHRVARNFADAAALAAFVPDEFCVGRLYKQVDTGIVYECTNHVGPVYEVFNAAGIAAAAAAALAAADAMVFKGVTDCSVDPVYPAADAGHTYKVSVAGKIGGASGINVEVGDWYICLADSTAAGDQATVGSSWAVVQGNLDGAVIGPASATDGLPAVFDGATGRLIKAATASAILDALGFTANAKSLIAAADYAAMRALLDLEPGTDVQAYSAALATLAGLAATTDNFIVAVASAWASRTPAQAAATLQGDGSLVDQVGFRGVPLTSRSEDYTLVMADAGRGTLHPSADTTPRTQTIPANASVAFPVGTAHTWVNQNGAGVLTIAITTDTMRLAGAGTTGSRTLAANGVATALKITSTEWLITGTGLT